MGLERHHDGLAKIRERLSNEQPLSPQERSRVVRYLESVAADISAEPEAPMICTQCAELRKQLAKWQASEAELRKRLADSSNAPKTIELGRPFDTGLKLGCGLAVGAFLLFISTLIVALFLR